MNDDSDDGSRQHFASPPCFMHELDPSYTGLPDTGPNQQWRDVTRWRRAERERLLTERLSLDAEKRGRFSKLIAARLDDVLGDLSNAVTSVYWPIRGEPDLRLWMESIAEKGGKCALPVVQIKNQPLVFRNYVPGDPLERGIWNIPVPAKGAVVLPDVIIAPVIGFDTQCYRLGFGGGYYDRTLAGFERKPHVIGVGYEQAAISTIYPQPHDIPLDLIVTEHTIHRLA